MKTKIQMLGTALLIGGLTLALTTQAQRQPGQGRPGGGRLGGDIYSRLDLTEKQQTALQALQEKQRAEMRKLFEDLRGGDADRQALSAKLRETNAKFQKQIEDILTEAQKKKLAELRTQRPERRPGQGGGRRNPLADLGLTEAQQKKLNEARQEMSANLRALFQDRDTPREERAAKMQELRDSYEAAVKKVLTPEQLKKYQAARAGGGQNPRPGGRPGQGGGRRDPYEALKLTEEQQKKVTAISAEQREEMTKMFQELRANGSGLEGAREKMAALRAKYDKKIEALLTDEQKKKFLEMRENRGRRPGQRPDRERPRPKRSDA